MVKFATYTINLKNREPMKKLILLTFLLAPFFMNGQCYLTDGMTWRTQLIGTDSPEGTRSTEIVSIEQNGNDGCFNMYRSNIEYSPSPELVAVIRIDGDKVYFRPVWSEYSEWYLAYDFGLKPGEGCYVYYLSDKGEYSDTPRKTYVKCVSIEESSEEGGWSMMILEEYYDDSYSGFSSTGKWIKGLSAFGGILYNNRFDLDGMIAKLLEVSANGKTLYLKGQTGNAEIRDSSSLDIRVDGRYISVLTNDEVCGSLYSGAGAHIGDYRFGKTPTQIRVPDSGVYILRTGDVSRKIFIP